MSKIFHFFNKNKKQLFTFLFFATAFLGILLFHTVDKTTNKMIIDYVEQKGWKVSCRPVEIKKFFIPEVFDDVYLSYNNIQKLSNLDLEPYKGKNVTRYSYQVFNHIKVGRETRVNIIIQNGKIIAGDISQSGKNGFIHEINDFTKIKKDGES